MEARNLLSGLLLGASLVVVGCAAPGERASSAASVRSGYGVVDSVQLVDRDDPSLLGTVTGGVVGGLLGHQIGGGRGQTAATIAGAVGGAYAGSQIERRAKGERDVYRISVRMNDGTYQTIVQETDPGVRPGDRVRIQDGMIWRD